MIHNDNFDPVRAAEELNKLTKPQAKRKKSASKARQLSMTASDVIYWIDSIVIDIVRLYYGRFREISDNMINNIDYSQDLYELSGQLNLRKLMLLSDLINKAYYEVQGSINTNLLFEQLLIDWKNCKI